MIEIEINDEAVTLALRRAGEKPADTTPLMQEIGEYLVGSTKTRFGTGKSPEGVPWAPKSPVTKAAYVRQGHAVDHRPLFGPSKALSTTVHAMASGDQLAVGSGRPYAATMQFGAAQGLFGAFIG